MDVVLKITTIMEVVCLVCGSSSSGSIRRTTIVVMTHGFAKQQAAVPAAWIALALRRQRQFAADPEKHSFKGNG